MADLYALLSSKVGAVRIPGACMQNPRHMPYMDGQYFHDKRFHWCWLSTTKTLQPIVAELEYCHYSKRANHPYLIAMGQLTISNVQLLASRELSSVPGSHNPGLINIIFLVLIVIGLCTVAKATSQNAT